MKYDQFDFEQQIMSCWNVTSDIKEVSEYLLDAPLEVGREDKIANMLIGIESLYNVRFDKLFRMFEQFNRERYEMLKQQTNSIEIPPPHG
jgi:hypothetical protein